jgi:uncharacterized protein (UPF0332 family)
VNQDVQDHLARAEELLRAAQGLIELGCPPDSISRSYYAIFHAGTAALLEIGIQRSSHHALWAAFGQFVIAPGLMEAHHHQTAVRLFADRSRCEYRAKPGGTCEDAERDLAAARDFVAACREFIEGRDDGAGS